VADFTAAVLGALPVQLFLVNEIDWGTVTYEDEESANVYADVNSQLTHKSGALRHMQIEIKLTGSSKDDLITQENALRAELGKPQNTLVLTPATATHATTYTVLRNPAASGKFNAKYERLNVGYYMVTLICEPWGAGETKTVYTAYSGTSPELLSLGTLVGQGDPRLRVKVTRDWAGAGVGMEFCCVALCTGGSGIGDYVYEAEDSDLYLSWYDYAGNPNCEGGHAARLDAADTTAWLKLGVVVPASGPPPGRYRVFARARATTGDTGYIAKRKQYSTDRDPSTTVTLDNTKLTWNDLGEWVHYGSDSLRLYGKAATGGLYIDRVVMLPVDWGWVWYSDLTDVDTDNVSFGWLYDHTYANTGAPTTQIDACGRIQGHGLKAPLTGYDLLIFVEPNGSDPDPGVLVDVSYITRWEMFW